VDFGSRRAVLMRIENQDSRCVVPQKTEPRLRQRPQGEFSRAWKRCLGTAPTNNGVGAAHCDPRAADNAVLAERRQVFVPASNISCSTTALALAKLGNWGRSTLPLPHDAGDALARFRVKCCCLEISPVGVRPNLSNLNSLCGRKNLMGRRRKRSCACRRAGGKGFRKFPGFDREIALSRERYPNGWRSTDMCGEYARPSSAIVLDDNTCGADAQRPLAQRATRAGDGTPGTRFRLK